ncbi:sensor histidine kinase [Vibrio tapetis subsp. quintayensis]|uniref:sensor histidine kinase VxrA n=1 Tax=Vibrio tapetis TaxID=52443 RepID=UPI0025B40952|nr:sensor histidine kinase VxrA [Vibrio tapetis]MDN3680709.1 sensor histidine kinase [Vibrio tapetis subsp. quintayensis]
MLYKVILLATLTSIANVAQAESLPERIDAFRSLFDNSPAIASYDTRIIQSDFPNKLLAPESMLPQTADYPLRDVQRLYSLAQTCKGKLPLSPLITEPLVFTRAMCKGTKLPLKWFARSALIHPGGGTYAARYAEKYPVLYDDLKDYMHIKERPSAEPDSLLGRLQEMDYSALSALIAGSDMFIHNNDLWLRQGDKYLLFERTKWSEFLDKTNLRATLDKEASICYVKSGNICWEVEDHSDLLMNIMIGLVLFNVVILTAWATSRWNNKREEMRSRMLVLQILTHELRTPIASLSLTVEGFRREFERLPESVYDEFRRLCEDSRRLRQLAEASKDYLQSDNNQLATEWLPSVNEWLEYRYEELSTPVEIQIEHDSAIKINIYWLGTCLDNLVNNAVKYGATPIKLKVIVKENKVRFEIIDNGTLSKKDWKHVRKPFVSKSGLGLGLTIVESMVERMGGKMSLEGPPTTFILEIPCETDSASS